MGKAAIDYIIDGKRMVRCAACKELKPIDDFHIRKNGRPLSYCKSCRVNYTRQRRVNNPGWWRKHHIENKYSVTYDEYISVLQYQEYKCAICRCELKATGDHSMQSNIACIDHNHTTGKLRGLLCLKCNALLGYCGDSIALLKRALTYLEIHSI